MARAEIADGVFGQRAAGEIVARIEINDRIAQLLSGDLAISIANLAMAGFYTFLMFRYDPLLTLIGISIAALNLAVLRYVSRSRTDASRRLCKTGAGYGALPWQVC